MLGVSLCPELRPTIVAPSEASCGGKGLAGAPDNEAEVHEDEEVQQRSCVVYLLWVGAGISARPRGCAPSAV